MDNPPIHMDNSPFGIRARPGYIRKNSIHCVKADQVPQGKDVSLTNSTAPATFPLPKLFRTASAKPKLQEWEARASRVRVRALCPNLGYTLFRGLPVGKSLPDAVFGATPKNTRRRRMFPGTRHRVCFRFRSSG